MKNIVKVLSVVTVISGILNSCQVDTVEEPTFVASLGKSVYKVGETVRFNFSGDADFVTIFTGVDNYNAGSVEGTVKGSRYIYRQRAKEPGTCILSFNCRKDGTGLEDYAGLELFISTDFDGDVTMDGVRRATWTDITDRAKWPDASTAKNKNISSGPIDLSEWNGKVVNVAFRYTAKKTDRKHEGWTISSCTVKNTVDTDELPFTIWQNASSGKFGTTSDKLQEDGEFPAYVWKTGTSLTCAGMPGGEDDFESWVISSPFDPSQVTPDYGTLLKSYSEVVPEYYDYKYQKSGKFTATVVTRNATAFGNHESVQNFEIEIVEDLYDKE